MADRSVVVRLRAEIGQYQAAMAKAAASTKQFGREMTGAGKTSKADLEGIGRGALVMAGGLAVGLGASVKAAVDWESAWAGVTKTVDGSASEMADLEEGLRNLAKELPATHGEIAAVAEAAGALGIQRSAIEGFTKTMIDLGETTDLTADQAATSFARIANIMGTSQQDFDRMGSTLVELGNNGASTESEILELANRLAAAGNIAGLTEADIFAMASTLASVGVEAEAGGTALSKVFTTVSDAVLDGSDKLDTFARVAGVSADEFATAFRDDPAGAINDFVLGLGRMIESGQSLTPVFEELELTDSRLMNALKSTAGAGDLLTQALEQGRSAWEDNNALQTEAEKRYDTTAAKMEIARTNIVDLGINIGGQLLPVLAGAAEGASKVAQGFSEMPGPLKLVSAGIGGAVAAGLGMAAAAALLIPKLKAARDALLTMGAAGRVAAGAMPWLAAAAAAIGVVAYAFGENAQEAEDAENRVKGYTDAIREAGSVAGGAQARLATLAEENSDLASAIEASGLSLETWANALSGSDADFQSFISGLREAEANGADFGYSVDFLAEKVLPNMRGEFQQGAENAEILGNVLGDTGGAAQEAAPKVGSLADKLGLTAEEAEAATEAVEDYQDAIRAGVDPVFAMADAIRGNQEAQQAYTDALKANSDGIKDNNVSQAELDQMMQDVAESALDVETAASDMALAMANGDVTADGFRAQLARWVEQGTITQAQADALAWKFGVVAGNADKVDGDRTARLYGQDHASPVIDRLNRKLLDLRNRSTIHRIQVQIDNPHGHALGFQLAAGGPVPQMPIYRALGGPSGSDVTPAWLTPGEYVMRKSAVDRFGAGTFAAMNAGRVPYGTSGHSSSSVFSPSIVVHAGGGADGRRIGEAIVDELRAWTRNNGPLPSVLLPS